MMTRITRKDLTQWAADAGVAVETAEKLFNLAGHEIEPEPDEIMLLVRQIGASLSDEREPRLAEEWLEGFCDTVPRAQSIRAGIEAGREYERRRILGDAAITHEIDGSMRLYIASRAYSHNVSTGAVLYPLLRRLTGAE